MKLKETIVINKINDEYVLVDADGSNNRFNGLVKLNDVAKDIIDIMKDEVTYDEIVRLMFNKYDVDEATLKNNHDAVTRIGSFNSNIFAYFYINIYKYCLIVLI